MRRMVAMGPEREAEGGSRSPLRLVLVDDHEMVIEAQGDAGRVRRAGAGGRPGRRNRPRGDRHRRTRPPTLCSAMSGCRAPAAWTCAANCANATRTARWSCCRSTTTSSTSSRRCGGGASGYLLKSISSDELVRQLEFVRLGQTALDPGMAARAADTAARLQRDEFWPGGAAGPHPAGERDPVLCGQRAVQPRDRHQTGDRRRNGEEPSQFHLPQARSDRSHRCRRHRTAGGGSTDERRRG